MESNVRVRSRKEQRSALNLMFSGVGSIGFDQTMKFSRRRILDGSIASDWRAVGKDIAGAIDTVKGEKNPV